MCQLWHHREIGCVDSGKSVVIVRTAIRVRSIATENDQVRRFSALDKLLCGITEFRIRYKHGWSRVTHDVIKLVNCEAPVQRDKYSTKPGAGELHLNELDSIL